MKVCEACADALVRGGHIKSHFHAGVPVTFGQGECEWCTGLDTVATRPDLDVEALNEKLFGAGTWTP